MHPDEQHLVGLHVREIVPAVRWVVRDPRGLAAHMGVDKITGDQIVVGEAARVAQRQRRILYRPPDRAPHVDDAETVLQEFFRVGAEMVAHPARRRVHGMVIMHLPRGHGEALPRGVAHVVVEDGDTASAQLIAHQALDFRVVDALDLLRRIEIRDRGWRLDQGEAVAVERELRFRAARVLDCDVVRIVGAVPTRHAGRRLDAVPGGLFGAAFEVMERRGEGFRGYSDIERHDWTPPMLNSLRAAKFSLSAPPFGAHREITMVHYSTSSLWCQS